MIDGELMLEGCFGHKDPITGIIVSMLDYYNNTSISQQLTTSVAPVSFRETPYVS